MIPKTITALVAVFVALLGVSCGPPSRPAGLPPEAIFVPGLGPEGSWFHCWLDQQEHLNRCDVFNAGGESLNAVIASQVLRPTSDDNVWLPLDESGPVAEDELRQIDTLRTEQWALRLKSGKTLVPRVGFQFFRDEVKRMDAYR